MIILNIFGRMGALINIEGPSMLLSCASTFYQVLISTSTWLLSYDTFAKYSKCKS